jgi:hypothetical protein
VLSGNNSIIDAEVQIYLGLIDDLANALRSHGTSDLSDEALQPIRAITSRLEIFSSFL